MVCWRLGARAQDKDTFTPCLWISGFRAHGHFCASVPPEQIIKEFAAKESEFQEALNHYTYRRKARVQTIDDDNKVDGEWYEVDDVIFDPTGQRTEKVVFAPENTLQRVMMSPSDLQDISAWLSLCADHRGYCAVRREVRGPAKGGRGGLLRLRRELPR